MTRERRRGIALFAALALLVVIGLLAGGAVMTSAMSQRSHWMSSIDAELTSSANFALATVLSASDTYRLSDLSLGAERTIVVAPPQSNDSLIVGVTRLPRGVLWLVATARARGFDGGLRRFNLAAQFPSLGVTPRAPIVSRGAVKLGDGVVFHRDTSVDAECDASDAFDVATVSGATVTHSPSDSVAITSTISGTDSATFFQAAWQRSRLDSAVRIVRVLTDTTIVGGTFDGLLVVDGSLTITGSLTAAGLIVVRGRVSASAGRLQLNGALVSFGGDSRGPAVDLAAASILFSPCAVSRVLRAAMPPRPVPKRSWAEMF